MLGPEAGIVDIECDGPEGERSYAKFMCDVDPLTMGWSSARGPHRIFRYDPRLERYRKRIIKVPDLPGLEVRIGGNGKQLQSCCPPTPGTDGRPREWNGTWTIADLAESVFVYLDEFTSRPAKPTPGPPKPPLDPASPFVPSAGTGRGDAYALTALRDECQAVAHAPVGQRNETLNRSAFAVGQLVGAGALERSLVEQVLLDAARACGLLEHEAAATIQSGLTAGHQQPRDLSDVGSQRTGAPRGTATAAPMEKSNETQAQALLRLAGPAVLWHTPEQRGYASLPINGRSEHHEIRSVGVRRWLTREFYRAQGKPPSSEAMQGVLGVLEAQAVFDGAERPVFVRCAERDGTMYLDLGDDVWHAVEIAVDGWRVVTDPPVRFRRPAGLRTLPEPRRGESLDLLRRHVNVQDDDFVLLAMWLVAALRASGPYPILALTGEQGSAKSTLARVARVLVDPHVSPLRSEPREARDLMIAARNSWIVAIDNISAIPSWLSDSLCRLATGGGYATRTLYSNEEETFLDAQRPVILNGIVDYVSRGDLIDRCLFLHLPTIPEQDRKAERDVWRTFEADYPLILGALLDAVSGALRVMPTIRPASLPRMADFAVWGQAACVALGWDSNSFTAAYAANRRGAHETILEDSPVAGPVCRLVERDTDWTGTPTELLGELAGLAGEKVVATPRWPKSPRSLTGALRRLAPTLRAIGIDATHVPHTRKGGQWTLAEKGGDDPSQASRASPQPDFQGQPVTDRTGRASPPPPSVTDPSPTSPSKTLGRDACDGRDGSIPTLSGGLDPEWEEGSV
jgi:hypothetical protein